MARLSYVAMGKRTPSQRKRSAQRKKRISLVKKDRAFLFSRSLFGEFLFDRFEGLFGEVVFYLASVT